MIMYTSGTSSLFSLGIGGAATPPKVSKLIDQKLPQNFSGTGWGMTETNAQGASLTGKAFFYKPGSAGFPAPIVDIRICDEQGEALPEGDTGEIWVRSCANISEYWHRPEANREEFRDGWLKTGDIGYLDDEGFLFLADRAKDMIIRGGENIYPRQVEELLFKHDAVGDVAVVGLPSERMGEEVGAFLRAAPGQTINKDQLFAYLREQLSPQKTPRFWFEVEEYPLTGSGKIQKFALRQQWLDGQHTEI